MGRAKLLADGGLVLLCCINFVDWVESNYATDMGNTIVLV